MKWIKHGLIFGCQHLPDWADSSALTPTPILLNEQVIRVYTSFRDQQGVGRIGYVDLDAGDPRRVLQVSEDPVLDIGRPGCFDDNGMILGDVVRDRAGLRLYYVGFQKVKKAKFLAFSGVAVSRDGASFKRVGEVPVLDRCDGATTIRAIHSVIHEEDVWKIWYAAGDSWQQIDGTDFPKYNIWYTESKDGFHFPDRGYLCVDVEGEEYRIGRPSVYQVNGRYLMFYTKGGTSGKDYFPGVAYSDSGKSWRRDDNALGLDLGVGQEFDSIHLCYPRLVEARGRWWAVYNGNHMGRDGFGLAELVAW
jgi:hypothetical protein